jgi:hypothetical protein
MLRYSVTPRNCVSVDKLLLGKIGLCWAVTIAEFSEEGNKVLRNVGKSLPVDIAYISGDLNFEKHGYEDQKSRK